MSTTRLRLHVGIVFVGRIRSEKGRGGGERDAEETPDECDLLPLGGHSWARAGQVQSAGDQRKFQQNSQRYSAIVGLQLSIISDYGGCSTRNLLVKGPLNNATSQNKNTCKSKSRVFSYGRLVKAKSDFVTWSTSLLRPVGTVYLSSFRCPL